MVGAFCCGNLVLRGLLHLLCLPFVLELTRLGMKMEGMVARDGDLKGASEWLVGIGAAEVRVRGAAVVPGSGPLLFVANHAGLGDAHAVLASSPRRDTRVLANDFGILPALRQFRRHVIVVDAARPETALRAGLRHLRAGGSLLLYPRGEIEADPGLDLEAALDSLPAWSASIELFARHVPGLAVVPVATGGVLSRRALRNWLVRRYREREKRHFLAATFQMMFAVYRDPVVSVAYGRALHGNEATRGRVLERMACLLARVHRSDVS